MGALLLCLASLVPQVMVKGWAWSGGGRAITRVDVTPDGGKSWVVADITDKPADPSPSQTRSWGWTLWTAFVPVPEGSQEVQLAVRAVDVACNTQPEHPLSIWNYRGLANNAWHRVNVKVAQPKAVETPAEPELLK
jgi:sulfite oxidase